MSNALEEAKKLADLGIMATAVVHEINQPVGVIRAAVGAARLDLKQNLLQSEEIEPLLERLWHQTERLHGIIENFRRFARGDRTPCEIINLNYIVRQTTELFPEQFTERKINFIVELHEEQSPLLVYANPFQLEEVLLNLLTNARDAVEERENATVWVKTWRQNGDNGFSVEDNGPGLAPEYRQHLFIPFVSTKTTEKGTGLGLHLSRKIIEDVGGQLCYAERSEGGACFMVSLPERKG